MISSCDDTDQVVGNKWTSSFSRELLLNQILTAIERSVFSSPILLTESESKPKEKFAQENNDDNDDNSSLETEQADD